MTKRTHNGLAADGAESRGGKASHKELRRRKYEADPESLHPDDKPGRSLRVSEDAVRDLASAFGMTMGTGR